MATNKILYEYGTPLLFADHATDFVYPATDPTAANNMIVGTPTPTEVQANWSVIASAAAWQSAKTATLVDTGTAWPIEWVLGACMESTATPAAGGKFDFYWNSTPNSTAANGNSGGCSGTDLAYTAAAQKQLKFVGSMIVRANVINIDSMIGVFTMPYIYGSLVMFNNTSVAMVADADADQCYVTVTPRITHIQAAA